MTELLSAVCIGLGVGLVPLALWPSRRPAPRRATAPLEWPEVEPPRTLH